MEDIVSRLRVLNFMGPWSEAADEIERLRKEIARLQRKERTMNKWQKIRTAPKDGTNILLYGFSHDEQLKVCSWVTEEDGNGEKHSSWYGWEWFEYEKPTHWMHLPEPPAFKEFK